MILPSRRVQEPWLRDVDFAFLPGFSACFYPIEPGSGIFAFLPTLRKVSIIEHTHHVSMPTPTDWQTLCPFESRRIEITGQQLHYLDEGSGDPLLMVHGNPTWSFYWRELVGALRDQHRIVVPDHIGCGLSSKPTLGAYPFTLARRIEDLCELIEQLNLSNITLVAHDWGGAIGMGAAARMPDRFGRFVLLNTGAFHGERCPWRIRVCRIPGLGALAVKGLNLFARAALRMAVCRHDRMTPSVRAGLLAPYDRWSHRVAVHQFVVDIPLSQRHRSHDVLAEVERGLSLFRKHPVCLVWGMRDWCFTPAFLERFVEFFPQADVHRFDDAGHYVVEDAHERIIPIIQRFVEAHPSRGGYDSDAL